MKLFCEWSPPVAYMSMEMGDILFCVNLHQFHGQNSALVGWEVVDFITSWYTHSYLDSPLGGDKVSMLTHTYPCIHRRKTKVAICNHQGDSPLYVWPDVWSGDLQV